MKQVRIPDDIATLGTILVVGAHPDDETYLAAGIMACAVRQGQTVACVTATKGEAGLQDPEHWTLETLGDVRAQELAAAMKIIGVTNHSWLGYHDGDCDKVPADEAVAKIEKLIEQFQPDTILTFGPEGMTGHHDHMCASRWSSVAAQKATKRPKVYHAVNTTEQYEHYLKEADEKLNIFFNIDKPPIVEAEDCAILFDLPPELRALKRKALMAMPSQTAQMFKLFPHEHLEESFALEAFILSSRT